jgi:hypothetical protein
MPIVALLLSICLTTQVLASPVKESLDELIDQYEYQMTVEWDQEDSQFLQKTTQDFYEELSKLSQNGLNEKDILDVLSSKSLGADRIEALKHALKPLTSKANKSEELAKIISEYSKDVYQNGASWNGSIIVMAGVGIVAVSLLGYSIWFNSTHSCVSYAQGERCGWYPTYYGGQSYYQCWVETYCVQYVKN